MTSLNVHVHGIKTKIIYSFYFLNLIQLCNTSPIPYILENNKEGICHFNVSFYHTLLSFDLCVFSSEYHCKPTICFPLLAWNIHSHPSNSNSNGNSSMKSFPIYSVLFNCCCFSFYFSFTSIFLLYSTLLFK